MGYKIISPFGSSNFNLIVRYVEYVLINHNKGFSVFKGKHKHAFLRVVNNFQETTGNLRGSKNPKSRLLNTNDSNKSVKFVVYVDLSRFYGFVSYDVLKPVFLLFCQCRTSLHKRGTCK
jgi:hypothetical protein